MKCCYFVSSDFIKKDEIFNIEITIVLIAPHHIEFEVSNIETNKLVEDYYSYHLKCARVNVHTRN